jgi:hypothetical protein
MNTSCCFVAVLLIGPRDERVVELRWEVSGRLRRILSGWGLSGGPRRCGERTERGKLHRCSGPKKQNDGRPPLFGCVDASLCGAYLGIHTACVWSLCGYSTLIESLRSTFHASEFSCDSRVMLEI